MAKRDRGSFEIAAILLGSATFIAVLISLTMAGLKLGGLVSKSWLSIFSPTIAMAALDVGALASFFLVVVAMEGAIYLYDKVSK